MNLSQNITKNIKSFLAYRIFFILLIFTTLPFFIYDIFLYITEYYQEKAQVIKTNSFIASQIRKNLEKDLELKEQILDLTLDAIDQNKINLDRYLADIASQFKIENLFYAVYKNNDLVIQKSAKDEINKKNINSIRTILNKRTALFTNSTLLCNDCIYFSKTIFENNKPAGVVVLSVLQKEFMDFSKEDLPANLEISIIDLSGKVIISTDPSLKYLNLKNKTQKIIVKDSIDDNAYTLVLSMDIKSVQLIHLKNYFLKHGLFLVIAFSLLMAAAFILIKILSKPADSLLNVMHDIKTGDMEVRYQKHRMGFEINYLGFTFNEMMDTLILHQKQIEKEKLDKLKYQQELATAQELQLSLLPDNSLHIKGIDLAFGNIYAKEVGGDFYDFIEKDGKLFFVIADIASKGILACLYALTLRSIVRSFATYFSDLNSIILNTNKLFIKDAAKNYMFATAFFGLYDKNTKKLEYCNCGHMPAILRRKNDSLEFLTTKGHALGIEDFNTIEINHTTLKKDDLLFLYTDGIIDAINLDNKFFGEKNLQEFIKNTHDLKSKEVVKNLFYKLNVYSKDTSQYDDATVVVFTII